MARVCGAAERDGCAGGVVCRSASGFLSGELQNNVRGSSRDFMSVEMKNCWIQICKKMRNMV